MLVGIHNILYLYTWNTRENQTYPKTSVPYHRDGVTRCWSSTVSRTVRGKYCAGGADHHPPHLSDQSRCPLLNAGSQNFYAAPQGMQARGSGDGSATVVATAVLVRMRCATRRNGRDFYWNLFRYYMFDGGCRWRWTVESNSTKKNYKQKQHAIMRYTASGYN